MIEALNQNSGIYNKLAFKADSDVKAEEVKSDLVTSPENDEFKKEETDVKKEQPKKKKHLVRKIALGVVSSAVMIYGSIVLKRKLSKPSFEEVQKCFQEIFSKDLSKDEVKELINKYKTICKNNNTEDFSKKLDNADKSGDNIILLHNHPKGLPPSIADINNLMRNKNVIGITVGHDGSLYKYTRPKVEINEIDYYVKLRHYKNLNESDCIEQALINFQEKFGFTIERL